jgi:hypothetical protein
MKLPKPLLAVAAVVAAGALGVGAWAAIPSGGASRPTVQLNATTAAATSASPTVTPSTCETEQWPAATDGKPAGDVAGGGKGFYLWHDPLGWHLEVTHPTQDHVVFSGWFNTAGTITFQRVDDEHNDVTREGPDGHVMSFVFNNYGAIDGVHFETHCATSLTFHLFIDGTPAGVEQVYVGQGSVHPLENPFTIDRDGVH